MNSCQLPVASCQSAHARRARARATAFSVTELLIVIGILVIVLALAVPAFNLITGSKSVETASNNIAAMLSRARAEAIGLQQMRGVFFYIDPETEQVNAALVEQVDKPVPGLNVDVYLDLTGDRDMLSLPRGVSVQVIDDGGSSARPNDRYLGFNTVNANLIGGAARPTPTKYGGVILFDARGQLTSKSYALRVRRPTPGGAVGEDQYTPMGILLYQPQDPTLDPDNVDPGHKDVVPLDPNSTNAAVLEKVVKSQLGYVLFDFESFKNATEGGDALEDWQVKNPSASSYNNSHEQLVKEAWLDANATAVLINRYTGTLVKGE